MCVCVCVCRLIKGKKLRLEHGAKIIEKNIHLIKPHQGMNTADCSHTDKPQTVMRTAVWFFPNKPHAVVSTVY